MKSLDCLGAEEVILFLVALAAFLLPQLFFGRRLDLFLRGSVSIPGQGFPETIGISTPKILWIAFSSVTSSEEQKVIALPSAPARAVLPILCT